MMPGLLDFIGTPEGQGLLSAAFGGLAGARRGQPINGLGRAGLAGLSGYVNATERKNDQEQLAKRNQLFDLQMKQAQQAQADAEARKALAQQSSMSPGAMAVSQNGGPTMAAANAMPTTAAGFDYKRYSEGLAGLGDVSGALSIQQSLRKEQPKLSKLEAMKTDDGRMVNVAVFEDGTSKVLPYGVKPEMVLQSLGDRVVALDKNAIPGGQSFKMGQSPDSVASGVVTMRGQNMADARSREAAAVAAANGQAGRTPAGYRMKPDGTMEAVPGGPADIKAGELGAKTDARRAAQMQQASAVLTIVDEAKDMVGLNTAGVGSWLSKLPATEARDLAGKLQTVKANLGFDRLQQMRDSSPTGGALGSVAVQELSALQSTVSSLDQAQSPGQLKASLAKVERHYQNWQQTMKGQLPDDGRTGAFEAPPSEADIRHTALKHGMTPAQVRAKLGLK